jgi:hypothetical protein
MAIAVPIFYGIVVSTVDLVLLLFVFALEIIALLHCLAQRPDAFSAIGTLSKGAWLGLMAIGILLTGLGFVSTFIFFALLAAAIPAVYMLDVRPALRDAVDGSGPW